MAPTNPSSPRAIGTDKEIRARAFLESQGLRLVASNFRCRVGEIDLIMHDADTLVFVEVRFRASMRFGGALVSVDMAKQRRLIATAGYFLQQRSLNLPCRFDILAFGGGERIDWIRDAFHVH